MRILETALYAENLDQTADFYQHVLGLERFAEAPGRHVFFRTEGQGLLLFKPSATRVPPSPDARLAVPPHGAGGPGPGKRSDKSHRGGPSIMKPNAFLTATIHGPVLGNSLPADAPTKSNGAPMPRLKANRAVPPRSISPV